ncbi:hypothetical protein RJ640_022910 [Escallonia rubra]|uniref:Uncharacterized protein n=1 Tax=Escallonia rubra TaxID=112253 RepID=A0AA88RER7_9ASTE|nr:hypothetical protein RJ640_022910 [Escallonia rubra]
MIESQRLCPISVIARLLQECKTMRELKQIHAHITTSPHLSKTDRYLLTSRLLFSCTTSNSASLRYAAAVFQSIHNPNLFMYNTMIRALACKTNYKDKPSSSQSLILYKQMLCSDIVPDHITFPFLLKECVNRVDGEMGRSIHAHVFKFGLCCDVFVQNLMISLYGVCGVLYSARRVFDEMSNKDVVSWNSMVIGCLRSGALDLALELFGKMKKRNVITWNSIITGFVQGGRPKEAIEFFHEMQVLSDDMVSPDKITVASVVSACASLGGLDQGRWVHSYLVRSGLECDMVIGTALVDMYGKCGCVERAVEVFKQMPRKDVLAWTAMISVFALHGYGEEAFDLFQTMVELGVKPNPVTFVGLLSACAHSGLVDKGSWCFNIMRSVFLIEPQVQHYACMVDILSRAGEFDEAERLIRNMPMEPDVFVWGALLGGCQMHGHIELGEKVAQNLISVEPVNHAFYVTLRDIYAKGGRFDDVKRIRAFMNDEGIEKEVPGSSMVEIDGLVYEFSVRGAPGVVMEGILCVIYGLTGEMKIHGNTINLIE